MKIISFILILTFITFSSTANTSPSLLTVELQFNEGNSFKIKTEEENISYLVNPNNYKGLMPQKYYDSIKELFGKNGFKCSKKYVYSGGLYETFYCSDNKGDFSTLKLNFIFEDKTITLTENELFEKKDNYYYFNFRSSKSISTIWIPTSKLQNK